MRGVSLEEISSATRISTRFLTAIESGHWEELPGGAFNRGFIRSASRYLGLDEDGMVAEYSLETDSNGSTRAEIRPGRSGRDWKRIAISAGVLVLLVAGLWFAGSRIVNGIRARRRVIAPPTVVRSTAANETPATPAAAPLQLVIRGTQAAKLRVIADGKVVADDLIQRGQEKHFSANKDFRVSASDSSAVQLELNGHAIPQIGPSHLPGTITLSAKDLKSSAGGSH